MLSPKVAVALNFWVVPGAMLTVAGLIATDLMVTAFTCKVGVVALTPSSVAVIVALPGMFVVTKPDLDTESTEADDFQVTAVVRSWVEPSLNLPVAVSCMVVPSPNLVSGVVTLMEDSLALVTVKPVEAVGVPNCAPIVVAPAAIVVVFPATGFAATALLLDDHLMPGAEVRSWTLPPPKSPVA